MTKPKGRHSVELLLHMAIKNLRVQYRSPLLGFLWAFIVPFCMALIFKLVFSVILRISVAPYPFFIYVLTAVFPWGFSHMALLSATTSIVDNKHIVRESMFPREIVPHSVVLSHLVILLPSLLVVLILMVYFHLVSPLILLLPVVLGVHVCLIAGVSLITSTLYVRIRDVRFGVELLLNALFYVTPIFYPLSLVAQYLDDVFLRIYMLNPFVGLVTWYRICFLKGFAETLPEGCRVYVLVMPIISTIVICVCGAVLFRSQRKEIVDYLEV